MMKSYEEGFFHAEPTFSVSTTDHSGPSVLRELLDTLVELNKLIAEPGEKSAFLYKSIRFVKDMIRKELK